MSEEQTVVSEATEESTEQKQEVNADSSVEDIMESREKADDSGETTAPETEQSDKSGEDVKTQEEEVDTSEKSDDEVEGKPIPYERFKEVNEKSKAKDETIEQQRADLERAQEALQDPEVIQLVLKKRGYTDEAIADYFKENSIEQMKSLENKEYDLNTVDGWKEFVRSEIAQATKPIEQTISRKELEQKNAKQQEFVAGQEKEVAALAKEKYGLELGDVRNATDTNTAAGKMWKYLQENKDVNDIADKLGYVKIFKLAMAEEALAKGVEKGIKKEKERNETVKAAASEGDANVTVEETPNADWSVEDIQAWRDKHGGE